MANAERVITHEYKLELTKDEANLLWILLHDVTVLPPQSAAVLKYDLSTESVANPRAREAGVAIFNAINNVADDDILQGDSFDEFFNTKS